MAVLDSTQLPDPANTPYRPLAMRYGAIWAVIGIFLTLIAYLTNTDPSMPTTSGMYKAIYTIIGLGVATWAIVSAIRIDRDEQLGGFIGLGRCVGLGSLIGLVAGIISALFFAVYMTFINTGFSEQIREGMIEQWQQQGMSEAQIEQALGFSEMFTGPAFMIFMQIFWAVLLGLIIGLIAGLIMKREQPLV
jgi:hypothetical protein